MVKYTFKQEIICDHFNLHVIFCSDQIPPHRMDSSPRRHSNVFISTEHRATTNKQTRSSGRAKREMCLQVQKQARVPRSDIRRHEFGASSASKKLYYYYYCCIICRQTSHSRAKRERARHAHRRRQINCSAETQNLLTFTPQCKWKHAERGVRFQMTPTPFKREFQGSPLLQIKSLFLVKFEKLY
jgi:hypothetical protein